MITIGYESFSGPAGFFDKLEDKSVDVLVDVRCNAISRKRGFSKGNLALRCEDYGIIYKHEPRLGISSAERLKFRNRKAKLFQRYEEGLTEELLDIADEAVGIIDGAMSRNAALMCFENEIYSCHRYVLTEAMVKRHGRGVIKPKHIVLE